jgi:hypothetical protein
MIDPLEFLKSEITKAKVDIETTVQLGLARVALSRVMAINTDWADRAKAALGSIGEV